jgi:hypothetical protein
LARHRWRITNDDIAACGRKGHDYGNAIVFDNALSVQIATARSGAKSNTKRLLITIS